MLIELFLALFFGLFAGTLTGLIPGVHINLVGAFLISASVFLLQFFPPIILIIFIVSMAITHTFVDFIPSILLGAPDTDTALSVLPGHELLKKGKAYEAILMTAYGSFAALFIILITSPFFIFLLPKTYNIIKILIPYILILATGFIILNEKEKFVALFVILLSGFLGIAVLNSQIQQPFLPLLTGLFGASSLIISIKSKIKIPKQQIKQMKIDKRKIVRPLFASLIASPLCSFLPGIGSGQAAVIGNEITKIKQKISKEQARKQFLILLGATNTIVMGLSFIVFYAIERKRTGAAVVVSQILQQNFTLRSLIIIFLTILLAGIICFFWTKQLAKFFSKHIHQIDYTKLSLIVLAILAIVVLIFSGALGLLILIISTATGIFGILSGVRRINLMGCLLIPTILIYLV